LRLTDEEVSAIKEVIMEKDQKAKIYLFGSRADNSKKGGDIDLLIISQVLTQENGPEIRYDLWDRIGEQKIDIVIAKDKSHPFTNIALREGVLL
jgi:predicted nucleotidyltransferase